MHPSIWKSDYFSKLLQTTISRFLKVLALARCSKCFLEYDTMRFLQVIASSNTRALENDIHKVSGFKCKRGGSEFSMKNSVSKNSDDPGLFSTKNNLDMARIRKSNFIARTRNRYDNLKYFKIWYKYFTASHCRILNTLFRIKQSCTM